MNNYYKKICKKNKFIFSQIFKKYAILLLLIINPQYNLLIFL